MNRREIHNRSTNSTLFVVGFLLIVFIASALAQPLTAHYPIFTCESITHDTEDVLGLFAAINFLFGGALSKAFLIYMLNVLIYGVGFSVGATCLLYVTLHIHYTRQAKRELR